MVPKALDGHLKWWVLSQSLLRVLPFIPQGPGFGWGAHCEGEDVQSDWEPHEVSKHINVPELRTILIAIKLFASILRNKVVLMLCDNSAAVSHLEKGGGVRSWPLYSLAWLIFSKTAKLGIVLHVRHIAGALKCYRGLSVQERTDYANGMEPSPSSFPVYITVIH